MYFPILRGRRHEYQALLATAPILTSSSRFLPIIEPITQGKATQNHLKALAAAGIRFGVVVNPRVGPLATCSIGKVSTDFIAANLGTSADLSRLCGRSLMNEPQSHSTYTNVQRSAMTNNDNYVALTIDLRLFNAYMTEHHPDRWNTDRIPDDANFKPNKYAFWSRVIDLNDMVEMPELRGQHRVDIMDGRHRLYVMIDKGLRFAKVTASVEDATYIAETLGSSTD